jgi:hypothetical protein
MRCRFRIVMLVGLTCLVGLTGCRRGGGGTQVTKAEVKTDPWARMAGAVSKFDDQTAVELRQVLEQLNSDLANAADPAVRPAPLPADRDKAYRALFPNFTPDDWAEVNATSFTKLDAPYLLDCQLFREAVRSLEVGEAPPADRAKAAFAWVCRLVYLNPTVVDMGRGPTMLPPAPPGAVLRRGWGSGLERSFVFLAALQQLGLDGCLIGPAGRGDKPWAFAPSGTPATALPPGPFWGVGVRVEKDVLVFNPFKGEPAPGPNGSVGTLARVKANPDLLKTWITGAAGDLTAEDVKSAEPYVAVPVSALAPRWQMFEEKLSSGLNLGVDPVALRDGFGPGTKVWCPPDPFDVGRTLATFLPPEDGGRDVSPQPLIGQYKFSQLPRTLFSIPAELQNSDARLLLVGQSSGIYDGAFLSAPTPRERIARGQFFEATKDLVEKEKRFTQAATRFLTQQAANEPARKFASSLNDAFYAKSRELSKASPDPAAVARIQQGLDQLLKDGANLFQQLLDATVGLPAAAESTYLLAQCKHEIAERFQSRADRTNAAANAAAADPNSDPKKLAAAKDGARLASQKAGDAWAQAVEWWDRYESARESQGKGFPGRAAHAKALADRARTLAGK